MGVCFLKEITMKTIIAFAFFLAVASADTCTDCTALGSTLGAHLVSEHSLAEQDEIMVNGLCPQAENVAECEEQLPNFWESIALVLWPAYYAPEADWMCAGICKAPEDHAMTCEECQTGIMKSQEQLLNPKTIDYLVEQLTPLICASVDDERCPTVVDTVIRQGLPLLAAGADTSELPEVCNAAVAGTCPARRSRFPKFPKY